jgi:hypothetical protein
METKMPKISICALPEGHRASALCVFSVSERFKDDASIRRVITKALFELSRTTDTETHFDPAVHTLPTIASGLPGHIPLSHREADDVDMPYHIQGSGDPTHGEAACLDPACHDRYFRDCCEDDGTAIVVNMVKARDIHLSRIREVRNAELKKLDVPFMRALEDGNVGEQERITGLKTRLRDIPQTIDLESAGSPEDLKAVWSDDLPVAGHHTLDDARRQS